METAKVVETVPLRMQCSECKRFTTQSANQTAKSTESVLTVTLNITSIATILRD